MRTLIQLACLLLATICGRAQNDTIYLNNDFEITDHAHYVYYRFVEQKEGLYFTKDYYRNHALQGTGSYRDSTFKIGEGLFLSYDLLGNKISEGTMVNGKEEGWSKVYNRPCENGNSDDSEYHVNGVAEGLHITRNHNTGKLIAMGYVSNNKTTGRWAVLYPSGDTNMIRYYINGLENGPFVQYEDLTHKKLVEAFYHNGIMVGTVYSFLNTDDRSDTNSIEIHLDSVNRASTLIEFDSETHGRARKIQLLYGKPDGLWIEYYLDTTLVYFEATYKAGEREGVSKTYSRYTGNLVATEQYKNGELNGHIISYTENGQIESDRVYNMGNRTGPWKSYQYNDDGTLEKTKEWLPNPTMKETIYKNGKPASVNLYSDDILIRHTDLGKPKKK
jgi:uncharacterized protein